MRVINAPEAGVKTRLLDATAKRGARIAAEYRGAKIVVPYDLSLRVFENHQKAAELAFTQWRSDWIADGELMPVPSVWTCTYLNSERMSWMFTPVFILAPEFDAVLSAERKAAR